MLFNKEDFKVPRYSEQPEYKSYPSDADHSKERKVLLILSILIILNYFVFIDISNLSFLNADVEIDNPYVLSSLVVISWVYYIIRHHQYVTYNKSSSFKEYFLRSAKDFIEKPLSKKARAINSNITVYSHEINVVSFREFNVIVNLKNGSEYISIKNHEVIIPYLWSIVYFIINSDQFTQFIIPYIVAGLAFFFLLLDFFP